MSYPITRLGEVFKIQSGGTPSRKSPYFYENGTIPWIKTGNLKVKYINEADEYITQLALDQSSAKLFPPKTVLVAMYGATIGACSISNIECATNQACAAFLPNSTVNEEYLYYCLSHLKSHFIQQAVGGAQPNISLSFLNNTFIPLPPLPEQQRIAAVLSAADALCQKRRETLAWLEQLVQSTFYEMFGDLLKNPFNWNSNKTLGEVAEIVSGITKGRKVAGKELRSVPYLAVANVQDRALKLDNVKMIDATEDEIKRYRLLKDDLLLTEGGDPDKLGRGTLWDESLGECIHQNHIFRVRIKDSDINPIFLNFLVGSPYGKSYFLKSAKQTTGIASINSTQLKSFPLLLPPYSLQQKFAEKLEMIQQLQSTYRSELAHLESLFDSLMYHAFQGHLVFSDEGIENLMAQMQAEVA